MIPAMALIAALLSIPASARADEDICGPRNILLARIMSKSDARIVVRARVWTGATLELLASGDRSTWYLLAGARGQACVLLYGSSSTGPAIEFTDEGAEILAPH